MRIQFLKRINQKQVFQYYLYTIIDCLYSIDRNIITMKQKNQTSNEQNLKELFEQFKFHLIYQNKRKKTQPNVIDQYKKLLSELSKENKLKRQNKIDLEDCRDNMSKIRLSRPVSTVQSRLWTPKNIDMNAYQQSEVKVLVVENERRVLLQQISSLEVSYKKLMKDIAHIKESLHQQDSKMQKYKHISFLSKSIKQETDNTRINNVRYYQKVIQNQDQTLSNLRKFKTSLRKENEQLENKLLGQNNRKSKVKMDTIKTQQHFQKEMQFQSIDKKFMKKLQQLMQLLKQKQVEFEEIKNRQTTKIRYRKVNYKYLKQERIQFHEMIQKFENKYQIKIQSLPTLILFVYQRLIVENKEIELQCMKRNNVCQNLIEDLNSLNSKAKLQLISDENEASLELKEQTLMMHKKINENSHLFLKFVTLMHNLLGKFKYLFTITLTLSMQKKNFQQLLIQIGNIYKSNSLFFQKYLETLTQSQTTNYSEIEQLVAGWKLNNSLINRQDLYDLIFSDLRYSLIFKRSWFEQQEIQDKMEDGEILNKMFDIQCKCEEIFDNKIKMYSNLIINCVKALTMNKYQKKMVLASQANQSLFLGFRKSQKLKFANLDQNVESQSESQESVQQIKTKMQLDDKKDNNLSRFLKDPRKIIKLLQKQKNEQNPKFKLLNRNDQKVYLYDKNVVLPKYIL